MSNPDLAQSDPTQRFSDRVENYVRYRPGYPPEVLELVQSSCGLTSESTVADIGSGTGIFSQVLLTCGSSVIGVEPNDAMRREAETLLKNFPGFRSIKGTAESTTLPDHSVDIITAAQAAHWFRREEARQEFLRILKPDGWVVLIWNERDVAGTPFLIAYEQLLIQFGTDYTDVRHERTTDAIADFFAPSAFESRTFRLRQEFDYPGLEGRLLSSSYVPRPGHKNYDPMLKELQRLFAKHNAGGKIALDYFTRVYLSQMK